MRRIVINLLREAGFGHVSEAEDGTEALRKLEHESIHFIVSDWNMPRMTGIELLKAVRHSAKLKDLPFLLITAESHKENIIEAAQAGADGYILKPFTAAMLTQKIEAILKRKGLS
jgi:two-component system chemotaxis response regulator CheY